MLTYLLFFWKCLSIPLPPKLSEMIPATTSKTRLITSCCNSIYLCKDSLYHSSSQTRKVIQSTLDTFLPTFTLSLSCWNRVSLCCFARRHNSSTVIINIFTQISCLVCSVFAFIQQRPAAG
uniref:Putative secreted protein n=1 Tax=Ixodes scapularis TaxID=6945 RepID=A0A4D5RDW0_IXOSC